MRERREVAIALTEAQPCRINGVVLITGASSGVGQATARLLAQQGYTVFGTSRDPTRAETLPGVEMPCTLMSPFVRASKPFSAAAAALTC